MGLRRYIHVVLAIVIASCAPFVCFADDCEISFDHFTMIDGLSQNSVTCLFQDSQGFLWIGSQAGLNRFDGRTFKVFKNEPMDPHSLSSNYINAIAEDADGNLWIATEYGLCKFNRFTASFRNYFSEEGNNKSLSSNEIYSVLVDSKKRIWVKTANALELFDQEREEFRKFTHFYDLFHIPAKEVRFPIFEDSQGGIWVGTNDGLNYFDEEFQQFVRYSERDDRNSISNNQVRCIFEDSFNNLWIGTASGLNLFDRKKKRFEYFFFNKFMPEENSINSIVEDTDGNLWLGTSTYGLVRFDTKFKLFKSHRYSSNISSSIASNTVFSLYKDNSEILWVGTRSGLDKLDVKNKKFQVLRRSSFSSYRFSSNDITAVETIGDSLIVVGTRNKGINIVNTNKKDLSIIAQDNSILGDNSILSIVKLKNDSLFIGTSSGAFILDAQSQKLFSLSSIYGVDADILTGAATAAMEDKQGNLWIGTNLGLLHLHKSDSSYTKYRYSHADNSTISSNDINVIFEDSQGGIWIGTSFGLNRMEVDLGMFERKLFEKNSNKGPSNNTIYSITEDDLSNLWIGTAGGLNKLSLNGELFYYFTERDGLPNNQIYSAVINGTELWMSSNKGLAKIDLDNGDIKTFAISDGLQGYEFNPNAGTKSSSGLIYFGGVNGLNMFEPDSIHENRVKPKVVITSLEVINENGRFLFFIEGRKRIELPANNHNVTIEFAGLEFTQPMQNNYEYLMEGLDNEWIKIGSRNFASFSNLPSGRYSFKVRASNNDLVWCDEPVELELVIQTPFYKTTFAYIIYVISLIGVLYFYIEYRTNKLRKANKILTEQQAAAREIEKQKEELSFKNKNITDSINYAKRIQTAIMPSRAKFKKLVPESFILYKPKDIVSGDFYWITEIDEKIFVASVDCTGHGVPGAFMSIIGFDLLRNITKEKHIHRAGDILTMMSKSLVALLSKNNQEGEVKDGMDLSLIVLHKTKGYLEYAGAFNPLYIIRNNKIETADADRCSLGASSNTEGYKTSIVDIEKGDKFYMFSDGYADQFGGEFGKKMKFRRFRHLLLSIHNLPFDQQEEYLEQYFNTWRGEHEQVDDILILGMNFDSYLDELEELYD